ncbi:hypothetical protein DT065_16145 [Salicibibacter kimchii]|uniref:Uncharacterized protein n=1 Tax=Salicibibacter kimchii TaxID=2099786 RepID=A0A345C2E1_9BACI|nr:GerAB/ArcD/ProY family transporter [Salicibibacter kimchii]AXF57372.1 hypothetical protein DT065_16145 [Salicibibacter kimchii]
MNSDRISIHQFRTLVIFVTCGSSLLTMPSSLIVHHDSWWIPLAGMIVGFPFVLLLIVFARWFPHHSLTDMLKALFRNWIGKVVAILFIFLPLYMAPNHIFFFMIFLNTELLSETPLMVLIILFMTVIIYGIYSGLEVLGRTAEIMLIFFVLSILILFIFLLPDIDWQNTQPYLNHSIAEYGKAILFFVARVIAVHAIMFFVFFPKGVADKKAVEKAFHRLPCCLCYIVRLNVFDRYRSWAGGNRCEPLSRLYTGGKNRCW